MRVWTEEQQETILDRDNTLLVAAAAGSGKTAVLVERIIQLILKDKVNIDQMLIVTFTQAAAGEMRARISSALLEELSITTENQEYLRTQINLLNRASISTLHSFCMEVVKSYFYIIDIDPKFRVGDTTETEIMKLEALENLLEEEYRLARPAFLQLVEMFGGGKDDKPLQDLILRTYEFTRSQPDPLGWLMARAQEFKVTAAEFAVCPWVKSISRQLQIELNGIRALFEEALNTALQADGPTAYTRALNTDLILVSELSEALDAGVEAFQQQFPVKHQTLSAANKDADPLLVEKVKDLRDQGKKALKDIQNKIFFQTGEEFRQDLNELYPSIECLYHLVQAFAGIYQEEKSTKGLADFNDLEHYALAILNNIQVADEYKHRYKYIFVDEYQDSNLVQETILNFIRKPDNLFLVGDVKQSIYRFRLADPTLFLGKYEAYQNPTGLPERRIDLSMNFRSRPEIIAGINDIFSQIMSRDFGEIEYDQNVQLNPGVQLPAELIEEMPAPALELILVDKNHPALEAEVEDDNEDEEDLSDVEIEARIAATQINKLVGQSFYDTKLNCCRTLEYKDMVVLMRAAQRQADIYYDTFMGAGIPVYTDVDRGYFQTLEINIFMNLLRLVDNKRQDIPLLSVLRSPIGRFSVDDLIQIRVNSQASTYYEAVEEYLLSHKDDLQARLQLFIDQLNAWKEESRFAAMDEFIWSLLLQTGYYYYVGAMPGGNQRQANLKILLDRAQQYQSSSLKGLFNFIKFVDKLQAGRTDMGMAKILGENENVVRIMSIHKSKGLEFPVVILTGLGRGFNIRDTVAPVLLHKELGIGPMYADPELRVTRDSLARMAIKNQLKMENLAEEMRILYVACTRPRDKLIMIGTISDLERRVKKWSREISPFQLSRARCHLDWIGSVVLRHRDGAHLRNLAGTPMLEAPQSDYQWQVHILSRLAVSQAEARRQDASRLQEWLQNFDSQVPNTTRSNIENKLNWNYPYQDVVRIPSKLSVSQIKDLGSRGLEEVAMRSTPLTSQPRFVNAGQPQEAVFSGAALGSIIHFVMQHLDLALVGTEEEIAGQVKEMVSRELLRTEEAAAVDFEKIGRFFASNLGQRVLQAPRVYREIPFNIIYQAGSIFNELDHPKEELLLQGVIDLYFREGDDLVLVDYKTDRITPFNREELISKYKVQVQLYKSALEKILNQTVKECYLYLFDCDEEVLLD